MSDSEDSSSSKSRAKEEAEDDVSEDSVESDDEDETIARIQRAHYAAAAASARRRAAPRQRRMSAKRKLEAVRDFHDFTKKLKKDTGISIRSLVGNNILEDSDGSSDDGKTDSDGLSEEEFVVNPNAVEELTQEDESYIDPETGDIVGGKKASVKSPEVAPLPNPINVEPCAAEEQHTEEQPAEEPEVQPTEEPKTLSISDIINDGDLDLSKHVEIAEVDEGELCTEKTAEELLDMKEETSQDYDITEKLKEMGEISVKPVKNEGDEGSKEGEEETKASEEDKKDKNLNALNVRRNIRDVMDEKNLDASTLAAQRQESERLARVQEQQRIIREVQRQISLNRQNKMHQKTMSLLQGGPSILKQSQNKLSLQNAMLSKFQGRPGQLEITKISKPTTSSEKLDQKTEKKDVVEIVDSSSGDESSSSSSDSDDCIMLSDSEVPPSPEADDDPGNSGLHVNDAYNIPDEQGRVLINIGHTESEEDIFLAPQIARIIKPHQIGGVRFLFDNIIESVERFSTSTGFGCILAHSMGLGKTLQIVCFTDIFLRHTTSKTVLCIMPINTLQNWVAEFNMWLPTDASTSPLAAHGEVRTRNFPIYVLNDSHKTLQMRAKVVKDWTTTGGVLMIGYELYRLLSMKKDKKPRKKRKADKDADKDKDEKKGDKPDIINEDTQGSDNTMQSKPDDSKIDKEDGDSPKIDADGKDEKKEDTQTDEDKKLLDEMYEALVKPGPDLVICDEGHRIKNSHSNISYALKQMRTKRRVVLTGYPLQNNLVEYWCMVDFVRPNYLGSKTEFCNMFERPIQNGQCIDSTPQDIRLMRYRAHVLHSLLVGFVQRRSHAVLQSTLPQKEEYVLLVRMTPLQRKLYDHFMNEVVRSTSVPNPLKAFAICCKIWNHPDVLYNYLKKRSEANMAIEEDLDLEELRGVTKAGRARNSKAPPRRPAKPRGSGKKPAATIPPNTTTGPAPPRPDPAYGNAPYPPNGPYGQSNSYPAAPYPNYPNQPSYYPPNQNYDPNYFPQQSQPPYNANYPNQFPQNNPEWNQGYNQNNWESGNNYYNNSGYYNNQQYPNNQPPQDYRGNAPGYNNQYPPNYNPPPTDQSYPANAIQPYENQDGFANQRPPYPGGYPTQSEYPGYNANAPPGPGRPYPANPPPGPPYPSTQAPVPPYTSNAPPGNSYSNNTPPVPYSNSTPSTGPEGSYPTNPPPAAPYPNNQPPGAPYPNNAPPGYPNNPPSQSYPPQTYPQPYDGAAPYTPNPQAVQPPYNQYSNNPSNYPAYTDNNMVKTEPPEYPTQVKTEPGINNMPPYGDPAYNANQTNMSAFPGQPAINGNYPNQYPSAIPSHLEVKPLLDSGGSSPITSWPITELKTEVDRLKAEEKSEIKSESDGEVKIEDLDTKKLVKDESKNDLKSESLPDVVPTNASPPKKERANGKKEKKTKTDGSKSDESENEDTPKKGKPRGRPPGSKNKLERPKAKPKPRGRKDRKVSKEKTDDAEKGSNSEDSEKEDKPSREEELALVKKAEEMTYDWATDLLKDYIPGIIENSAKMELFFYLLNESIKMGDRILLFSQSLFTLNLIEDFLERNYIPGTNCVWQRNVSYYRLDGSTHALEREKLINEFNANPQVYLFLVSTRAGSLGINLVGANRVIVFDASWNPCHDTQAVCRVYRYGQKKPCFVYRFVMDWCLEKKIYDRQINKQGMADRVVDECNPDAVLSMKEITNLCFDNDEKESEPKDLSVHKDKYIDVLMQGILEHHGKLLSKEPFQHESLLVDRKEKKLSSAEKRLAQRGYELEKKAALAPKPTTAYRTVRAADGSLVQRPVASVRPMQHGARWIPADVWRRQGMTAQEMTLPLDVVIPTNSAEKTNIVLKAGQRVMVLKSPKGIYMQLESGKIIAIKTSLKGLAQGQKCDSKDSPLGKKGGRPSVNLPGSLKNNSAITITSKSGQRPGFSRGMPGSRPFMGQHRMGRPMLPGQKIADLRNRLGEMRSHPMRPKLPMLPGRMMRPNLSGSVSITKITRDPKKANDTSKKTEDSETQVLDSEDEDNVENDDADATKSDDNKEPISTEEKSEDSKYSDTDKSKDQKDDSKDQKDGLKEQKEDLNERESDFKMQKGESKEPSSSTPMVLTTDETLPTEEGLENKPVRDSSESRVQMQTDPPQHSDGEGSRGDKKVNPLKNYRHQRPAGRPPSESSLSQLEKTASVLNKESMPDFRRNLDDITQSYSPGPEDQKNKSRKKKSSNKGEVAPESQNDRPPVSGMSHSVSSLLGNASTTSNSKTAQKMAPVSPMHQPGMAQDMGAMGHGHLPAPMPLGEVGKPPVSMPVNSLPGQAYPPGHPPEASYGQYPPGYGMGYGTYPNAPYYGGYAGAPYYPPYTPPAPGSYPPSHAAPAPPPDGYLPPNPQW